MPAHKWEDVEVTLAGFLKPRRRRCRVCYKQQSLTTSYLWMRVTGSRWEPLVGRCLTMKESRDRFRGGSKKEIKQ